MHKIIRNEKDSQLVSYIQTKLQFKSEQNLEISNVNIDLDELELVFENLADGDMGTANIAALYQARLDEKSKQNNCKNTNTKLPQQNQPNQQESAITSNQASESAGPLPNLLQTLVCNNRN